MLARTALRTTAARAVAQCAAAARTPTRAWSSLKDDHQYSAHATSHGSRADGVSKLDVRPPLPFLVDVSLLV
jgi:hypothetical protein